MYVNRKDWRGKSLPQLGGKVTLVPSKQFIDRLEEKSKAKDKSKK